MPSIEWGKYLLLLIVGTTLLQGDLAISQIPTSVVGNLTPVDEAVDIDGDPNNGVFELNLIAEEKTVVIDAIGTLAQAYTFGLIPGGGVLPGPQITVKVGETILVNFTNSLPEPTSIHWHGIELNNESDGTPIAQNPVSPNGGTFTYRFQVTRPGIFWYHPHFSGANQVIKGLYAPLIVTDDNETDLQGLGILPLESQTHTLVLSDMTVCKTPGANDQLTFPSGGPWAGGGTFPGHAFPPTPEDLCENSPRDNEGEVLNPLVPLPSSAIPHVFPGQDCPNGGGCRVNEGQIVLVNGRAPAPRGGTPINPAPLGGAAEILNVNSGDGLRLQIINASITRYFRLILFDQNGNEINQDSNQIPLFRVGGEGGLLDQVRLEGGTQQGFDSGYELGEILLAPSDRTDVVINIPQGNVGDILTLWTQDYRRNGPAGRFAFIPTVPILHLRLNGPTGASVNFEIENEDPLRSHPQINDPIENIKTPLIEQHLLDPANLSPSRPGSANEEITFTNSGNRPSINGIAGSFSAAQNATFESIPHIGSSRFARVGDLLELKVTNLTNAHHPFHLHGFSFQPVRFEDSGSTLFPFSYQEFVDTVNIPPSFTLVYRVRLDARNKRNGTDPGGAEGRWFFHCHIFHHAELGKTSELVVLPRQANSGSGDVNGDGRADFVWHRPSNGATMVWQMTATAQRGPITFPGGVSPAFEMQDAADVNGDGRADFIWHRPSNGATMVWQMTAAAQRGPITFPGGSPVEWVLRQAGDVNGDGRADFVWRNTNNGATMVWQMTAAAQRGPITFPGGVSLAFELQP